jgi:hypothetical protein
MRRVCQKPDQPIRRLSLAPVVLLAPSDITCTTMGSRAIKQVTNSSQASIVVVSIISPMMMERIQNPF